eukprot:1484058-Rhodomonas_salina.4
MVLPGRVDHGPLWPKRRKPACNPPTKSTEFTISSVQFVPETQFFGVDSPEPYDMPATTRCVGS